MTIQLPEKDQVITPIELIGTNKDFEPKSGLLKHMTAHRISSAGGTSVTVTFDCGNGLQKAQLVTDDIKTFFVAGCIKLNIAVVGTATYTIRSFQ